MVCPHCNATMRPDQVFCEKCGKEKLLVPLYEAEIEDSVAETMQDVVSEIDPDASSKEENKAQDSKETSNANTNDNIPSKTKEHHLFVLVGSIFGILALIAAFVVFFVVYTSNSYEYQYEKAMQAYRNKEYKETLNRINTCFALEPESYDVYLLQLHTYQQLGQFKKAHNIANYIYSKYPDNAECCQLLLDDLIAAEDYEQIDKFLKECTIESIVNKNIEYVAFSPEFDYKEGTYDAALTIKLYARGSGDIFYTLDGTTPDKYSERFTGPIKLISGDYEINAIYINTYGIKSKVTTQTYNIESGLSVVPLVSAPSGIYSEPQIISVMAPSDEYIIYYTTDGSDPSYDSNIYSVPIAMPLGKSEFRFMMIDEEGIESDIVTVSYDCQIDATYPVDNANASLMQTLIAKGVIADAQGLVIGTTDHKNYVCNSAVTVNDAVYYVFQEYLVKENSSKTRTGTNYAFQVNDGSVAKVSIDEKGNVTLFDF